MRAWNCPKGLVGDMKQYDLVVFPRWVKTAEHQRLTGSASEENNGVSYDWLVIARNTKRHNQQLLSRPRFYLIYTRRSIENTLFSSSLNHFSWLPQRELFDSIT